LRPAVRTWVAAAKRETRRWQFSLVELADGRVWLAGGETSAAASEGAGERVAQATTELWDPKTDSWSSGPALQTARAVHFGVRLASGRLVIGGGRDAEGERLHEAELWERDLSRSVKTKSLTTSREWAIALAMRDGGAIVIGGDPSEESAASTEMLSEETGEWRAAAPLPGIAELFAAATLQDGRVIASGGASRPAWANEGGVQYRPTAVSTTRLFDPTLRRWVPGSDMMSVRMEHGLVVLHDGRVLVTGGFRAGEFLATAEIWDWRNERWAPAGTMRHGRAQHATCALPDGRVLITGGSSADGIRRETEIWDPDKGTFSDGPSLLEPRIGHKSLVLGDGRVLVIGGSGRGGLLTTAELLVS
jgi:hypothetical protein